jgi:hypothetical protein
MLVALKNVWLSNGSGISRDLVHLLTKRTNTGTGGIAWLDALCDNNWGYGFSEVNNDTTFSFPNPAYTWNLAVVTHEIGHNIGARHTFWCGWVTDPSLGFNPPGGSGAVSNCVAVDGSCPNNPSPQVGTIMSYCHTVSGGSVMLEFHDVVVAQALNPGIANASCLTACSTNIYGCTDPSACNYNLTANTDDGSCILPDGCTDPLACNYDVANLCDDGSCILPDGCTDPLACNYDVANLCDDGSCILPDGCTDPLACNYDIGAMCDDGSCILPDGCTDATACNYDAGATCDDGSCYNLLASIQQDGDSLFAVTTPIGLSADWYNIQTEDSITRVWLMEEDASSFIPTYDCTYFIEVIDNNGCIATDTINYGANAARIGSFVTYPNPTSGLINVKFDNPKNQFVMLELISNNGSKLDEFITIENNLNIDLSRYPSGSYYLYFNSEDAVQGCRLEEVQKTSAKIILNK